MVKCHKTIRNGVIRTSMPQSTFFGGVHPFDGKDMSRETPIQTIFPHGDMVYPLKQHIGAPAVPMVRPGDPVLTGQKIAEPDGDLSAAIHSSVSGIVSAIEPRALADGTVQDCIIIHNDGKFREIFYPQTRKLDQLTPSVIIESVRDAGVVGLGGSGLPTHIKLEIGQPNRIDYCIANCVECEPYLTSNYRRMLENPAKVINGLRIEMKVFKRARGILAVDERNSDVSRIFRELTRDDPRIFVKKLRTKYPQGAERQLIYALTGRTLNASMLPSDIGCTVSNVDTLVAINQAVMVHEPLLTRIVTVSGEAAAHPGNFRVRIGMSYRELLERAGGFRSEPALVLDGGTMTGRRLERFDVPVTKLTSAVTVLDRDRKAQNPETPCTRCGRCVQVCPNHLVPLMLYQNLIRGKEDLFLRHNGLECSGCGCCSYACPSGIPLAHRISKLRSELVRDPEKAGEYARRMSTQ